PTRCTRLMGFGLVEQIDEAQRGSAPAWAVSNVDRRPVDIYKCAARSLPRTTVSPPAPQKRSMKWGAASDENTHAHPIRHYPGSRRGLGYLRSASSGRAGADLWNGHPYWRRISSDPNPE